ncbi:hypothetical protein [Herbaspirillum sp. RV1423]|uniref:hypothetical protein n=1 Tax=Herbaspirillum sp. RV1423 TaxID=1443993 RepID=UPI0004B0AC13|nr:hypothetical protein [Herbaspirillum sp. RV1423]
MAASSSPYSWFLSLYAPAVRDDNYHQFRYLGLESPHVGSVGAAIQHLNSGPAALAYLEESGLQVPHNLHQLLPLTQFLFPSQIDESLTIGDLLTRSLKADGKLAFDLRGYLYDTFAYEMVEPIYHELLRSEHEQELLDELKVSSREEGFQKISSPQTKDHIASILFDFFLSEMKSRTIVSLFHNNRQPNGYIDDLDLALSHVGTPLKKSVISITETTMPDESSELQQAMPLEIEITFSRYNEHGVSFPVRAYEWCATLSPATDDRDHIAYACGMIYTIDRAQGSPSDWRSFLHQAADQVADTDVLQMNSFFEQHDDASELILKSDLCFCWLWERKISAPVGSGALVLTEMVKAVRKKFKGVGTLILDTRPSQFRYWDEPFDIPLIAVQKQGAIESITHYVGSLSLPKIQVRHIFNKHEGNQNAAMLALGSEYARNALEKGMNASDMSEEEEDDDDFLFLGDYMFYKDEIARLLESCQYSNLADLVRSEQASNFLIRSALTTILLNDRIPYLPFVSQSEDEDVFADSIPLPDKIWHQVPGIIEFGKALPAGCEIISVLQCLEGPEILICVEVDHPYEINSLYTLIPKPISCSPTSVQKAFKKFLKSG